MSKARLQSKWQNFFRMLDEDGDGVISVEDFGLKAQRISRAYKLEDHLAVRCSQTLMRWWHLCKELIGQPKAKIQQKEFIQVISELYCNDKPRLEETMGELSKYLFDLMDANGDGSITSDELDKMNQCLGMKNSSINAAIFDEWDENEDGEISRSEYMTGMLAYLTSDDPNNHYGFVFAYDDASLNNNKRS